MIEEEQLIERSSDRSRCMELIQFSRDLLRHEGIGMTGAQWLSLVSHLSGMVHRSVVGKQLEPLDRNLFSEISDKSLAYAKEVVKKLPDLTEDEIYLLSIHFESALHS
ncbi:PRD domain-containing protein [Bacillus sp. 1P06AnD]|uniref:PRD domain-containing protein n=1 Tax=Bacillus sp. 1P06AnD TaxID=3132208 RepID=UPI0039A347B6